LPSKVNKERRKQRLLQICHANVPKIKEVSEYAPNAIYILLPQ
jgi:hypothetical protein